MIRKTAIVFGASGDIGQAICCKFAMNGYNLGLTYNSSNIEKFASELEEKYKIEVQVCKVDCKKEEEIDYAINKFSKVFGMIDVGVIAFGMADRESLIIDKSENEIKNVIDTNLLGTILANKSLAKVMIYQKHGSIINISSILATNGGACEEVYSATKAGIIGLTTSLASELGEYNIRVNCLSPGFIDTKMCDCYDKEERENIIQKTALSRLGRAEDVANAVCFLASEESSFITGVNLEVSGGLKI